VKAGKVYLIMDSGNTTWQLQKHNPGIGIKAACQQMPENHTTNDSQWWKQCKLSFCLERRWRLRSSIGTIVWRNK